MSMTRKQLMYFMKVWERSDMQQTMDPDERREVLEDAGLDPDEFDFQKGEDNKAKIYFTLTGTKYYHGNEFLKPGMKLKLKKKQDNKFDKEANSMQYWS